MSTLLPHQQRVVAEKAELDEKIGKLEAYINGPKFRIQCDAAERFRLRRQAIVMVKYSQVLGDRIDAFTPKEPA